MTLAPGLILEVLQRAGIQVPPRRGERIPLRCCLPGHDDSHPSAVVFPASNCFVCSRCGSLSAKHLAKRLGVPWPLASIAHGAPTLRPRRAPERPRDDRARWQALRAAALERARDDDRVDEDRPAWRYLAGRGLAGAAELGMVGILPPDADPRWHAGGYRVLAPLFEIATGELVLVQARRIWPGEPRTLFPRGARSSGTAFADPTGRALLRGEYCDPSLPVLFGEGLTDGLALGLSYGGPIICAPGTSIALSAVGAWAQGRIVLVALDTDDAGERAVRNVANAILAAGGWPARLRWPGGYKDACEILERYGSEGLYEVLDLASERAATLRGGVA